LIPIVPVASLRLIPQKWERETTVERIPILQLGDLLLVTIQVDMHDRLAMTLQDDLTERISQTGAKGVLIDISSLDVVDSFIGRMLANIAQMSRVLDAQTVVVGMRPAVAITLVELGMSLTGVRTALNVNRGMQLLRESLAATRLYDDDEDGGGDAAGAGDGASDGGTADADRRQG